MAENTREIVLDLLLTLERENIFSHKLIKAVLDKYDYLEGREKSFIKRLAEGTIERRLELDYYLDHFSTVPVNKMKPLIRCLMRMSTYQLLYMDGVPDSAVCNEAVKLAEKRKFRNLKGFVNGVLRTIAANKASLPLPDPKTQPMEYLSVKYSMPLWLVRTWCGQYGRERTEQMLSAMLAVHPVSIRFRTDMAQDERDRCIEKLREAGVSITKSTVLPYVYTISDTDNLALLPGYAEGFFTVQDVSSALAVEAAGIQAGDFVVDLCAAPGGKSMLAAEKVTASGKVLARDVSREKQALLEDNAKRFGLSQMEVQLFDACETDENLLGRADVVLADVPCSGLGVMGKKRDIKYHVNPEGMESLIILQRKILENSWRYVRKGGTLLYSTCTINPRENEETVQWITEQFPFVCREKRQFLPGVDDCDGFFYARLERI